MGIDSTASLSYGFIIPQSKVLKVLQKLQDSTKPVKKRFGYGNGAEDLQDLLYKHLEEKGLGEEDFDLLYLTEGEDTFKGLAILYKEAGEMVMVWGFGSQVYEPLSSEPWDKEKVEDANAAFKLLSEDSLFKELEIEVDPGWLLGCGMSC